VRQRFGVIALGSAWVHQGGRSAVVWDAFPRSKNTIYPYNNETMGGCCPPPLSSGVSTLVWREARWLVEVQRAKVIVPVDGVVGARVVARRRGKTRRAYGKGRGRSQCVLRTRSAFVWAPSPPKNEKSKEVGDTCRGAKRD